MNDKSIQAFKRQYERTKSAKVGDVCTCVSCGTRFTKTNYRQAFCRSKSGTVCKDKYWNTVTPEKSNNTTRISPARSLYLESITAEDFDNDPERDFMSPEFDDLVYAAELINLRRESEYNNCI